MINLIKKIISSFKISNVGICSICDKQFPDRDLHKISELALCEDDYELYSNTNWSNVFNCQSTSTNPQEALRIQEMHDFLKKVNIPSFIKTEYLEKETLIVSSFSIYIDQNHLDNFKLHFNK
ncbi:MAG: hypothetical protein HON90_03980 [Halobacteriovoraceae bacterium]|jgi:hypothetical protein|nr:hypothetical protein [Halobacteriovoraceae bacterium]